MTTLTPTTKQYQLTWTGEKGNYSSPYLGGLFMSETEINEYLDSVVAQGWTVLETSIKVHG